MAKRKPTPATKRAGAGTKTPPPGYGVAADGSFRYTGVYPPTYSPKPEKLGQETRTSDTKKKPKKRKM